VGIDDVVVVDLETTGLNAEYDQIIQIKIMKTKLSGDFRFRDGKYLTGRFRPTVPISPEASAVNGFTIAGLESEDRFSDSAHEIRDFIGELPIVGHNVAFSKKFLSQAFKASGVKSLSQNKSFCTQLRLREHVGYSEDSWYRQSLEDAAEYLGIDTEKLMIESDATENLDKLIIKFRIAHLFFVLDTEGLDLPTISRMNSILGSLDFDSS
jgi:DNA polymerase III epsilon subunit-like protein